MGWAVQRLDIGFDSEYEVPKKVSASSKSKDGHPHEGEAISGR
jgi:hypothetical protein